MYANYFRVQYPTDTILYQYNVMFDPETPHKRLRRGLFHTHGDNLFGSFRYNFDGQSMLFSPFKLHDEVSIARISFVVYGNSIAEKE